MKALLVGFMFFSTLTAYGHGGGRDSDGGHHDRAKGKYHFHGGPLSLKDYDTKQQAMADLGLVPDLEDALDIKIEEEIDDGTYDSGEYSYRVRWLEENIAKRQGGVFCPYTLKCFETISETDIEHIVARSEAHHSGLFRNGPDTWKRFARDPDNLALADPDENRDEKKDKDIAEWTPENSLCWYVYTVLKVKREWHLTMDIEEAKRAYEIIQGACPPTELEMDRPTCEPGPIPAISPR